MSDLTVARRYAAALYEEASTRDIVKRIDDDVEMFRKSLEASRELVQFFESPLISADKKHAVIDRLFGDRVHELTIDLLHLMVTKGRDDVTPSLAEAYRKMRDEQEGVVEANVRLATSLNEAERETLASKLQSITGQRVRLKPTVDPDLLGGLVVRIGDTVYDGSVRHQLERLREYMKEGTLASNGR
jgi:F-type H+-transporting ATPase subunit delta